MWVDGWYWKRPGYWPQLEACIASAGRPPSFNLRGYFTRQLPILVNVAMIPVLLGLVVKPLWLPKIALMITYVVLQALVGDGYWKNLIFLVPLINVMATIQIHRVMTAYPHTKLWRWFEKVLVLLCGVIFLTSLTQLYISTYEYPGGQAQNLLHTEDGNVPNVTVHIDALAYETGAMRFGQLNENWVYSRDFTLRYPSDYLPYNRLITSRAYQHAVHYNIIRPVIWAFKDWHWVTLEERWEAIQTLWRQGEKEEGWWERAWRAVRLFRLELERKVWVLTRFTPEEDVEETRRMLKEDERKKERDMREQWEREKQQQQRI